MTQAPDFADLFASYVAGTTLSLRALSRKSGIPRSTLINWRDGIVRRPQDWRDIAKVARALELDETKASALLMAAQHPPLRALWQMELLAEDHRLLTYWLQQAMSDSPPPAPTSAASPPSGGGQDSPSSQAAYPGHASAVPMSSPQATHAPRGWNWGDTSGIRRMAQVIATYSERQATLRQHRNRRILLDKVRSFWIEGVLESSLHGTVLLHVGMEQQPAMTAHPWDTILQRPHAADQLLPKDTPILEVFDLFGGSFLILGEPGSGKTTALLELCRALLDRAEANPSHPMPVVFNLSTWAARRADLEAWLLDELNERYQVPLTLAADWIAQDELLLLLDGLDEVRAESRNACVAAINRFQAHHWVHIVVCSRTMDYRALLQKLVLPGAVQQRPLTDAQIHLYLAGLGPTLAAVRAEMKTDPFLRELARSPLMLSIIALAYAGIPPHAGRIGALEERRRHLFDTYIQRMFVHRKVAGRYGQDQIVTGLGWLSRLMTVNGQTVFSIESLQPTALSDVRFRQLYAILLGGLMWAVVGISFGFACGFAVQALTGSAAGGQWAGVNYGVSGALGLWMAMTGDYRLRLRLLLGICFGFAIALTIWLLTAGSGLSLASGCLVAAAIVWAYRRIGDPSATTMASQVHTINTMRKRIGWSAPALRIGFIKRLPLGLSFGLVGGIPVGLAFGGSLGLVAGAALCLTFAVAGALSYGLVDHLVEPLAKPNEGIWRSLENGIRVGIVAGVWLGIAVGIPFSLITDAITALQVGLGFWVAGFVVGGIVGGGYAVLQHGVLRLLLSAGEGLPLNYAAFLHQGVYHIFLRRVGSGYIFVHRLLLEHFAARPD